jgi:putative nucleotidyltransferase with HDIG domain
MRVPRIACELGFEVEAQTLVAAREAAPGLASVAAERVFAEFRRIMIADRVLDGVALMDAAGVTAVVLPELAELRGVEQSGYHHLDVYDHTLLVLAEAVSLERDPGVHLGEHGPAIARLLAEPLANELNRGQALRFGALLHDIAKPTTRDVTPEGRVTFMGHDAAGAEMARAALQRLRASERLSEHVAALARHHLRLGFLVHRAPLDRREVYRYMRTCEPVEVDVSLLSVADRLATRGKNAERAIECHLELARMLLGEALRWRADPPRPPLRGDQLARAIGLRPGPRIGELLRELEEASFAGEISCAAEAIERARAIVSGHAAGAAER